jgi:hypothetical protein
MSRLLLELGSLQSAVTYLDGEQAQAMRNAGYPGRKVPFTYGDTPWKDDDAAWFKANPARSHCARPAFPGELPEDDDDADMVKEGRTLVVLLRQVAPGKRLKTACWTALDHGTIDALGEEYVHAWLDAVMRRQPTFTPLPPPAYG